MSEWLQARCQTKKWLIHPSIPRAPPIEEPGRDPQLGDCHCMGWSTHAKLKMHRAKSWMVPAYKNVWCRYRSRQGARWHPVVINLPGIYGALCQGDFTLLGHSWDRSENQNNKYNKLGRGLSSWEKPAERRTRGNWSQHTSSCLHY